MKTYINKESVLGQAFGICIGTSKLSGIYIKEKAPSGKIPAHVPAKSSTVRSASRRRTWGIGSRKNLMKAHLGCVSWAVKKAPAQSKGET